MEVGGGMKTGEIGSGILSGILDGISDTGDMGMLGCSE